MKLALAFALFIMLPPLARAAPMHGMAPGGGLIVRHHVVRHDAERLAFMRRSPCPATGRFTTDCPGWRVAHIVPPERGGAHDAANMKWERTDVTRAAD